LLPALAALLGGGTVGFQRGESGADAFWRETLAMLNAELDESQAKRDACLERLLERQP
jgi:hypothetical protein